MARGYRGAFGRKLNAPYVWIPLCLLFLAPFIDPRRPFRLLHLDLLVHARVRRVALLLQPRARSACRCRSSIRCCSICWCGCWWPGSGRAGQAARCSRSPPSGCWSPGVVFLAAFRVALNVTDSNVIDVGYAGRDRRRPDRATATASTATRASSPTSSTATPTGRRTTCSTCRSSRRFPGAAAGTTCRPPTVPPSCSTSSRWPGCISSVSACAPGRRAGAGNRSRLRLGAPTRTRRSRSRPTPTTRSWPSSASPPSSG